eukprot:SAG31_NODE_14033_length_830_cov_1.896033_2_plen_76_part_00
MAPVDEAVAPPSGPREPREGQIVEDLPTIPHVRNELDGCAWSVGAMNIGRGSYDFYQQATFLDLPLNQKVGPPNC